MHKQVHTKQAVNGFLTFGRSTQRLRRSLERAKKKNIKAVQHLKKSARHWRSKARLHGWIWNKKNKHNMQQKTWRKPHATHAHNAFSKRDQSVHFSAELWPFSSHCLPLAGEDKKGLYNWAGLAVQQLDKTNIADGTHSTMTYILSVYTNISVQMSARGSTSMKSFVYSSVLKFYFSENSQLLKMFPQAPQWVVQYMANGPPFFSLTSLATEPVDFCSVLRTQFST